MHAPLYDDVVMFAIDIVNLCSNEECRCHESAFRALKSLCYDNLGSDLDHPFQWEALGDLSESYSDAMDAYEKGLACAIKLELADYSASIKFSMAENCYEQGDCTRARQLALEAEREVSTTGDSKLHTEILELLSETESVH